MFEEKNENFIAEVRKMRNAGGQQRENERRWKNTEANRNTRTCVTRMSHVLIAQNNGKEMYKMFAARAKLLIIFFANEIYWFCCRPHCRRRLAQLHDFINCL